MPVPSDSVGLADSTLVMLLHDMAFKWADGCPKTYDMLLQDLFSSNGIPPVIIPASLTDLRPLPPTAQRVREISAAIDQESSFVWPQNGNVPERDNSTPSEITIKCEPLPSSSNGNVRETETPPIYFPDYNSLINIESAPPLSCNSNKPEADNFSLCTTEPSLTPPLLFNGNIPETVNSPLCSPKSYQTSSYNIQTEISICAGNSPINESGIKSVRSNKRKSTFTVEDGSTMSRGTKCTNTLPDAYNLPSCASKHFVSDHEHEAPVSTSEAASPANIPVQSEMDFTSGINTASDVQPKNPIQNFLYIHHGGNYMTKPIRAHMFISSKNDRALESRTLTIKDNESDKIYLDNILITDTLISLKKYTIWSVNIVISHKNNPNKCLGKILGPNGLKQADKNKFVNFIFNWAKENGFTTAIINVK